MRETRKSQARVDEALVQCSDDHDRGKCCALVRYVAVGQDCDSALFGREGYNSIAERGHRVDHCLRVTLGGVEHFEAAVRSVVLFADLEHVQVPEDREAMTICLPCPGDIFAPNATRRVIPSASRMLSSGGLVTWANRCEK